MWVMEGFGRCYVRVQVRILNTLLDKMLSVALQKERAQTSHLTMFLELQNKGTCITSAADDAPGEGQQQVTASDG